MDRASQGKSKTVKKYIRRNEGCIRVEYFPVGLPEFNAVEVC